MEIRLSIYEEKLYSARGIKIVYGYWLWHRVVFDFPDRVIPCETVTTSAFPEPVRQTVFLRLIAFTLSTHFPLFHRVSTFFQRTLRRLVTTSWTTASWLQHFFLSRASVEPALLYSRPKEKDPSFGVVFLLNCLLPSYVRYTCMPRTLLMFCRNVFGIGCDVHVDTLAVMKSNILEGTSNWGAKIAITGRS